MERIASVLEDIEGTLAGIEDTLAQMLLLMVAKSEDE